MAYFLFITWMCIEKKKKKAAKLINELDNDRRIIHLTGGTRGAIASGMAIISEQPLERN